MWQVVVGFALALIAVFALTPKPQSRPPAGLGDFDVPTAKEGRPFPVLFGTREIVAINTAWYGHLRTVAIRKKGGKK